MKNLTKEEKHSIHGGDNWIKQCPYEPIPEDYSALYGEDSIYYKYGTMLGNLVMLGFSATTIGRIFRF